MPLTTFDYEGIEFQVDYDYEPEEPATNDCPGADAIVSLNSVTHCGDEFVDILSKSTLAYISDRLATMIEENLINGHDCNANYLVSLHKDGQHG